MTQTLSRRLAALVVAASLVAGAAAQPSVPLVFHNNCWVNLHQRLYVDAGGADRVRGATKSDAAGGADEAGWRAAVAAYADLAKHDLLCDAKNVALNDALGLVQAGAT